MVEKTLVRKTRTVSEQTLADKANLILLTLTDEAILIDPEGCKELLASAESLYHRYYHYELPSGAKSRVPDETIERIHNLRKKIDSYLEPSMN